MSPLLSWILFALPLPPVASVPAWVQPVEVPALPADADGASVLLLDDLQLSVGAKVEMHQRRVWEVRTLTGVESLAQQELEWDPSSEKLTVHGLWVWRDGKRRSAWHPDDARVLQREAQLDEGIYDGRLTFRAELRDLRPGDRLEVAFTTSGENPVFGGRFSFRARQTPGVQVAVEHFRLVWSRERELAWKAHGGAEAPSIAGGAQGARIYEWTLEHPKAPDLEWAVPAEIDQLPWVEFSDWKSWGEVSEWAERLFSLPAQGERFEQELKRLRALPEGDRARAAIRFVQDDLRYVGVELGEHSHLPHAPQWVLERGFGDCKDKALVLVSLLRGLGLKAHPALVNSRLGRRLPEDLPTPAAFNHAIVRVAFPSGARFIDATQTNRRGDPSTWEAPDFAQALVIAPGVTKLEPLPPPDSSAPTWEVHQRWKVPAFSGLATLEVETVASGKEAARLRAQVLATGRTRLADQRRDDRAEELEAVLISKGVDWEDDEAQERFVVRERYEVTGFFDANQEHGFTVLDLDSDLVDPPSGKRTQPWSRTHPVRVKETISYDAPEALSEAHFDLENRAIKHPAFELGLKQRLAGNHLTLEWTYATRSDRLQPKEFDSYRVALRDARGALGYQVRQGKGKGPGARQGAGKKDDDSALGWLVGSVVVLIGFLYWTNRPAPTVDKPSVTARFKQWRFRSLQKGEPGELASNPVVVADLAGARVLFKSKVCPAGHAWPETVQELDAVRLGDERISVVGRKCATCGASEHRYAKINAVKL